MFSAALITQFRRARLELKVSERPLVHAGNSAIVQLDIARKPQQFLLWPGDRGNELVVQGVDRELQQLVLFVKEPARPFEFEVARDRIDGRPVLRQSLRRHMVWVQGMTPGGQRHVLCGMDEQHYFIAQLEKGVSTVREAHRALFNPDAGRAAQQAGEKLLRQGEWFFVRASFAEVDALTPLLGNHAFVRRGVAVRDGSGSFRRGRAHRVDELVQVAEVPHGSPLKPGAVYVRGKIRHPDHRVLDLLQWHRVFGNREASQPVGLQWAD